MVWVYFSLSTFHPKVGFGKITWTIFQKISFLTPTFYCYLLTVKIILFCSRNIYTRITFLSIDKKWLKCHDFPNVSLHYHSTYVFFIKTFELKTQMFVLIKLMICGYVIMVTNDLKKFSVTTPHQKNNKRIIPTLILSIFNQDTCLSFIFKSFLEE